MTAGSPPPPASTRALDPAGRAGSAPIDPDQPICPAPRAIRAARPAAHVLFAPLALLALLALTACDDTAAPPDAIAAPAPDAAAPPPVAPAMIPEVFIDLAATAERAHVHRGGPAFGPDLPGWERVATLAGRGPWGPPRKIDGRTGSWLDGIGGAFTFPVGADAAELRTVEFWLRPIARGQVVSVFLDETPVITTRLADGWQRYRFPIPIERLEPGEHTLRFWFRFTRYKGKTRTAGAFGGARLLPLGDAPPLPETWSGPLALPGAPPTALYAGPPQRWSWYLLPPTGGRFFARAGVATGEPVEFIVRLEVDGAPPVEARRVTVTAGTAVDVDVSLGDFAEQPMRISLETEGADGPVERAGWIEPRLIVPGRATARPRPARNLVVWVVDGLRDDRVDLGRGGLRAATPNLDMLATAGAAAVDVWSGGASAADGHRRLLQPIADGPSLATLMNATGRRTGFLGASTAVDPTLSEPFNTHLDLVRTGEPETRILLRELDAWLYVRKREPFFLYIASADTRAPLKPPTGYRKLYERARPLEGDVRRNERLADLRDLRIAYDAQVSVTDYWIGQLIALLHRHGVADDTALIVTGSVGQELRESGGLGDGHALVPEVFRVPLVVWHPGLRRAAARPPVRGGDLVDVGATALRLVGADPAITWPGHDLTTALFNDLPLPPRPNSANLGNQIAARFGRWLLRGAGSRDLRLYDLDAPDVDRTADSPTALRTLRDSMLDRP